MQLEGIQHRLHERHVTSTTRVILNPGQSLCIEPGMVAYVVSENIETVVSLGICSTTSYTTKNSTKPQEASSSSSSSPTAVFTHAGVVMSDEEESKELECAYEGYQTPMNEDASIVAPDIVICKLPKEPTQPQPMNKSLVR